MLLPDFTPGVFVYLPSGDDDLLHSAATTASACFEEASNFYYYAVSLCTEQKHRRNALEDCVHCSVT